MAPQTQKALVLAAEGASWELRTDWPVPTPGPRGVLVRLAATALNPAEWKIQAYGAAAFGGYPFLGGLDGAGVVEEIGAEVIGIARGDKMCVSRSTIVAVIDL